MNKQSAEPLAAAPIAASQSERPPAPGWRGLLLISLCYALLGALGLSLAIPPGYASPVFPAAGFALAVVLHYGLRALPAIWLGSFLLNTGVAIGHGNVNLPGLGVSASIAIGALLQAWLGNYLVMRWGPANWRSMDHERSIFRFLSLGGPLACLVAATVGISSLVVAGVITPAEYIYSWWSWYVGDTLGVLLAAPPALIMLSNRNAIWRTRVKNIAVPIVGALLLAAAAFFGTARWEAETQRATLKEHGDALSHEIENRIVAHGEILASLARLVEVTPDISFQQFDYFTSATLGKQSDIFALSFNPYVSRDQRHDFERAMARISPTGQYLITERDPDNKLVPAGDRPDYVAVGLISPLQGNMPAIGFDINSNPLRREAIQRSIQSRQAAATAPIKLIQETQQRVGVLVLHPVYQIHQHEPATTRVGDLKGFVVAVIKVDEMLDLALRNNRIPGLVVEVVDPLGDDSHRRLYRSPGNPALGPGIPVWETSLRMADRDWQFRLLPTQAYLAQNRSWVAWAVGVIGLHFAALLQVMILAITGRSALIQRQVEQQTDEIRSKNRALSEAIEAAEAANITKSRFLATMSHEIRTPMNGILGMAQMLLMKDTKEAERQGYARTILNSGKTLLILLNDILDLSKVEAGKLELDPHPFAPQQLLKEVVSLFSDGALHKGLQLTAEWQEGQEGQGGHLRYLADSHRIRQMLSNLIGNAIKFTEHGAISIQGRQVERHGETALLEFLVTDTGIGIPADKQHLLFQPFSQADSSTTREYGGSGLGLSIVRQFARVMGGDAGGESQLGKGSRFWFRIQAEILEPDVCSRVNQARPNTSLDAVAGSFSGRILVAEDNETNRAVIQAMLGKLGLTADFAEDGQQCIDRVLAGIEPDLILMDLQMPVMNGYEATERIREWETAQKRSPVPIVALTADAYPEDRDHCLSVGMDDYLTKPIDARKLQQVLARWLGGLGADRSGSVAPGVTTPLSSAEMVFDSATLLNNLGGDQEIAAMMMSLARKDMNTLCGQLAAAVSQQAWGEAGRAAHTLKGLALQVGGHRFHQKVSDIDEALKRGNAIDFAAVAALRNEYRDLEQALDAWGRSRAMTSA